MPFGSKPQTRNQNALGSDYDEGDRRGEMMATTSLPAFEVIVTGESAADVVAPSEHIVFRTNVNTQ